MGTVLVILPGAANAHFCALRARLNRRRAFPPTAGSIRYMPGGDLMTMLVQDVRLDPPVVLKFGLDLVNLPAVARCFPDLLAVRCRALPPARASVLGSYDVRFTSGGGAAALS
jgi:hypothetical protein